MDHVVDGVLVIPFGAMNRIRRLNEAYSRSGSRSDRYAALHKRLVDNNTRFLKACMSDTELWERMVRINPRVVDHAKHYGLL